MILSRRWAAIRAAEVPRPAPVLSPPATPDEPDTLRLAHEYSKALEGPTQPDRSRRRR